MRLKLLLSFILLLQIVTLKAQDPFILNLNNWEPGKCFSFNIIANQPDSIPLTEERYFKIKSPQWDTVQKKIIGQAGITQRVLVQEAYTAFVLRDFSQHEVGAAKGTYLAICHIEKPGKYKTITFNEKDTIKTIETYKLTTPITEIIRIDKKEFPDIPYDTNQSYGALIQEDQLRYFKLKKGNWTNPRAIYRGCHSSHPLVKKVQEKLIELGYNLEANNILGHKTKVALIDYQKKWGLPVGTLNFETLRALEVEF